MNDLRQRELVAQFERARVALQQAVERVLERSDALATVELAGVNPRQIESVRALCRSVVMACLSVEREAGGAAELRAAVASLDANENPHER